MAKTEINAVSTKICLSSTCDLAIIGRWLNIPSIPNNTLLAWRIMET